MYRFSGFDGELFFVSDPVRFQLYLEDCGDGFDWRPKEPLLFEADPKVEVFADGWQRAVVEAVHVSGRLSLARCARGGKVRAIGTGHHLTLAATGRWLLERQVQIGAETLSGARPVQAGETTAVLSELNVEAGLRSQIPSEPLLARLRTPGGCFQGMGRVTDSGERLQVIFEEGVTHGPL